MVVAPARERAAIRVALVDDHGPIRRAVRGLLASEPDIAVVGEAGTRAGAVALVDRVDPDLLLLDLQLPDGSGIGAVSELRSAHPRLPIVILTMFDERRLRTQALSAGADDYLLKDGPPHRLLETIRELAGHRGRAAAG